MSSATTTYPSHSAPQHRFETMTSCECFEEELQPTHFFRGFIIAIPTGLILWVGLLKLATAFLSHY